MRRKYRLRDEPVAQIPTGIVTVPSNKIRGYYSQFCDAEKFLARRRMPSGSKKEEGK